ncbi:tRNA N6-adenosine threonylcarbamoyltransferase, mitochondrial [Candidatus Entotheonellaceae bacterium PAL068K]
MQQLKRHNLFFLDSRTTQHSVAYRIARATGLPAAQRQVFLDNDPDTVKISQQLHPSRHARPPIQQCHRYWSPLSRDRPSTPDDIAAAPLGWYCYRTDFTPRPLTADLYSQGGTVLVLGIETSCDDTAAAVVANGTEVRASIVSSQDALHAPYGGVVPELACRSHVETLRPIIDTALGRAGVTLSDIDLIAVTQGPGLIGALLVGVSLAKALAYGLNKPLVPIHHLEGHMHSIYLEHASIPYPFVALVVSGGHTDLYYCPRQRHYITLGRTRDDAAGECFDKIAKMLHLGYPGGPHIDRLAQQGNAHAIHFPRAMQTKDTYDFSFSGVKTAVRSYLLRLTDTQGKQMFTDDTFWPLPRTSWWDHQLHDILASFQHAVVEALLSKTLRAVDSTQARAVVVVGGVACNTTLRRAMLRAGATRGFATFFPSPAFCTDNAAMIACAAYYRYQTRPQDYPQRGYVDLEADANLALPGTSALNHQ